MASTEESADHKLTIHQDQDLQFQRHNGLVVVLYKSKKDMQGELHMNKSYRQKILFSYIAFTAIKTQVKSC